MITSRIKEKLYRREPVFSFEFFPPKTEKGEESLHRALEKLVPVDPTFVSVTYGAGGSTREKTREIVRTIQSRYGLTTMAHLTCVGHTHEEIRALLADFRDHGIADILALRGDPPAPDADWGPVENGPQHAVEVVKLAREFGVNSVAVAGFPEVHPEAPSLDHDLTYLKEKVDSGADFIVTQLFFNNDTYFDYVRRARRLGITVPILPGIMPVTGVKQIKRFQELSGCIIPDRFMEHLKEYGDDDTRVQEIGLAYCAAQCVDLLRRGAPGIHFYTLNKSRACYTVYAALHALGLWNP